MKTYKLGELITQRREKNNETGLPIRGVSREGLIPPKQIDADTSIYNVFYLRDFIFNPARMELNSIAFNDKYEKAICSSLYEVFYVHREDIVLPEYLKLIVKQDWFTRYCEFLGQGSAREYCRFANISEINIELPDIETQKKAVYCDKVINERIALKKKINDNLVDTLNAIYQEKYKSGNYSMLPLKELCSKIGSGATPKGGRESYHDTGISLIRSTNVFDYGFSYPELAHIDNDQADSLSNVIVHENDVLFNITGVSVTRCCMVPPDVLPARVNQHVMILRPYAGKYMSYYILFTLCSSENKAKLLGIGQSGSTREAINKQEMEAFQIPVPENGEIEAFGKIAESFYEQIHKNNREMFGLFALRETLLSLLSSR
jgi:type I restriction enzyme S subunit